MGLISRYSYLRALLIGIPFGIGCLFVGIKGLLNDPKSVGDLIINECEIISWKYSEKYYDYLESTRPILNIKTSCGNFYVCGKEVIERVVKSLTIFKNHNKIKAKIYTEIDDNLIKELEMYNSKLVEFENVLIVNFIFICLGLVTLTSGLIYLIKHPEDLVGNSKK